MSQYSVDIAHPSKHNYGMNKLSLQRRAQIIHCLVEGNSVRATCRMTDSSKDAVLKLVADAGNACLEYQREHLRNLPCKRIQCDEIWSFVYSKAKNVPAEFRGQFWKGRRVDVDGHRC